MKADFRICTKTSSEIIMIIFVPLHAICQKKKGKEWFAVDDIYKFPWCLDMPTKKLFFTQKTEKWIAFPVGFGGVIVGRLCIVVRTNWKKKLGRNEQQTSIQQNFFIEKFELSFKELDVLCVVRGNYFGEFAHKLSAHAQWTEPCMALPPPPPPSPPPPLLCWYLHQAVTIPTHSFGVQYSATIIKAHRADVARFHKNNRKQ